MSTHTADSHNTVSETTAADGQAEVLATADAYDRYEDRLASLSLQLRDYGAHRRFTGPVRTVRCLRDNALVKQLLNSPGEGAVLVVDGGGVLDSALMGDLIAQAAVDNGWAGVIINGPVRDVDELAKLPLGIKALGSNPRKSAKDGAGVVDVTVDFGGVTFIPGATVWADSDGVLVEVEPGTCA